MKVNKLIMKPHWSFWLISSLALIWNIMGSMNFVMQMNPEALATYPDAARELIENRPVWSTGAFAIAVFIGAVGDIFLILRKRISYFLFIASFLGVVITNVHAVSVSNAPEILFGGLVSSIVAAFLIWYSKLVNKKNWIG